MELDTLLLKIAKTRTMVDRADMVNMLDVLEGIIQYLKANQPVVRGSMGATQVGGNFLPVRKRGS